MSIVTIMLLAATVAVQPPKPMGTAGAWITPEDYPADALHERRVGTTVFRLRVGADGKPLHCAVIGSSGTAGLDEKACALVMERGRFTPARNEQGQPVEADWENKVHWQLPDAAPFPPSDDLIEFDLDPEGRVSNCTALDVLTGQAVPESCERLARDVRTMVRPERPIHVRVRHSVEVEELALDPKAPN
nr:energy transducer TonB [Sphingomonas sp. Y57]